MRPNGPFPTDGDMSFRTDLISALMLLTRLPVRGTPTPRAADAAWAWPIAGLVVGMLSGAVGWVAAQSGLVPALAAGLALAVAVAVTGALHEDGLADVADGFWGGYDPARRLEIMRDSRIGTYGVVALILSLGARWGLLVAALDQGAFFWVMVSAAVASRAPMALVMRWLPGARADGLSHATGVPPAKAVWLGLAIGALALLVHGPLAALVAAAMVAAAVSGLCAVARRKIGGQTGDVLGASQQLAEIAILAALTAG